MSIPTTMVTDSTGAAVDLRVDDSGSGAVHLLLHGGAGPGSMGPLAGRLVAGGDRTVLPTHPGYDGTERPDAVGTVQDLAALYAALLDRLAVSDVTVIANSLGGWVALELALLHPERIGRFVLVDVVGIEVAGHPVADALSLSIDEVQRLSFFDPEPFRIDFSALPEAAQRVAAANMAALAQYAGPTMSDPTLAGRLSRIDRPTLVLWGDSDGVADPVYGQALAAAIPGARFVVLPQTGHLPQLERPDLVLAELRTFSAGHHAPQPAPVTC